MQINVFSGARRLVALCAVFIATATVYSVATERPSLERTYLLMDADGDRRPVRMEEFCHYDERSIQRARETPSGYKVRVTVCIPPERYRENPAAEDVAHSWIYRVLSPSDMDALDIEGDFEVRESRIATLKLAAGAMATLLVCTFAIGWVVRGFLGIPRGMDSRPEAAAPAE